MSDKKSKTKKRATKVAAGKPVRRRKPDALARAQAEVDETRVEPVGGPLDAPVDPVPQQQEPRPADILAEAAAQPVAQAGPLVELPPSAPHALRMADLPPLARRALAGLASNIHRSISQAEAFESDPAASSDERAPMGTGELVKRGLAVERRAFFITPLGAKVAESAGIEVTRPIASPAEVAP